MNAAIESLLFALLRPIKKDWLFKFSITVPCIIVGTLGTQEKQIQLAWFIAALPLMYFVMYVACKTLSWLGILQKCQQKSRNICQSLQQRWQGHNFRQQELCDEEQLPDRMMNPCEYQQLPQNRKIVQNLSVLSSYSGAFLLQYHTGVVRAVVAWWS